MLVTLTMGPCVHAPTRNGKRRPIQGGRWRATRVTTACGWGPEHSDIRARLRHFESYVLLTEDTIAPRTDLLEIRPCVAG